MHKVLAEDKINYYAKRIAHYLKGYRKRSQATIQETAHLLGMSESNYRKFESEGYSNDSKFMTAIETLSAFGKLENLNFHQFSYYLDNPNKIGISDDIDENSNLERFLYGWEKAILEKLNEVDIETRSEFIELIAKDKNDTNKLTRIIKLYIIFELAFTNVLTNKRHLEFFDCLIEYVYCHLNNKRESRIKKAIESIKAILK